MRRIQRCCRGAEYAGPFIGRPGPDLAEECRMLGGCATGEAKITQGYNLLARWVIHTVGPVWHDGHSGEDESLAQCYRSCLDLAERHAFKTIAFPSISTGIYGFPMERAARIAVTEIKSFLERNTSLEKIILVCFGEQAFHCHEAAVKDVFG